MEFTADHIHPWLDQADDQILNALPYGVIGFDENAHICRYNKHESQQSLLTTSEVIACHVFTDVARCMNNALIAGRFEVATSKSIPLDEIIDYVIAFKSGAGPVKIRMLYLPQSPIRYLLLERLARNG